MVQGIGDLAHRNGRIDPRNGDAALRSRRTRVWFRQTCVGWRQTQVGCRPPCVGQRQTQVGCRQTCVRRRQTRVGWRQTRVGRHQTWVGRRQTWGWFHGKSTTCDEISLQCRFLSSFRGCGRGRKAASWAEGPGGTAHGHEADVRLEPTPPLSSHALRLGLRPQPRSGFELAGGGAGGPYSAP